MRKRVSVDLQLCSRPNHNSKEKPKVTLTVEIDEIDSNSLQRLLYGFLHVRSVSTNSVERSSRTTDDRELGRKENSRSEGK